MKLTLIAINAAVPALTARGGGGDAPSQLTMRQSQTISGVAATGTTLPGATINVTCSVSSGTVTMRANGNCSAPITGASLPCMVTATSSDGKTVLRSLAIGSGLIGSTAMANTTSLTELLLAQLAGRDPTEYVAGFSSTTIVNASDVTAAQAALIRVLQSTGFDALGIGNFLGSMLSTGSGQGCDRMLDTLQSKLTDTGVTLTGLSTAVTNTSGSSSGSAGSTVGIVLAPADPACPAFRSDNYWLVKFSDGSAQIVTVDAAKLAVAVGGSNYQLTQGTTACDYTLNDTGSMHVLAAKSGVAVWTNSSDGTDVLSLSPPKQIIDPTTINRNCIYALLSGVGQGTSSTNNYARGVVTTATNCAVNAPCMPNLDSSCGYMVTTSDGEVDWVDNGALTGTVNTHAYGFRNAQGSTVSVVALAGGGVGTLAPQMTLSIPAVGTTSTLWQSNVKSTGLSAVTEDSNTTTAVNGLTVTRAFADTHTDQIIYNDPFADLRHQPGTKVCTNTSGVAVMRNETWQLPLSGLVLVLSESPSITSSTYRVSLSVNRPDN